VRWCRVASSRGRERSVPKRCERTWTGKKSQAFCLATHRSLPSETLGDATGVGGVGSCFAPRHTSTVCLRRKTGFRLVSTCFAWHLTTVLTWCLASLLLQLAGPHTAEGLAGTAAGIFGGWYCSRQAGCVSRGTAPDDLVQAKLVRGSPIIKPVARDGDRQHVGPSPRRRDGVQRREDGSVEGQEVREVVLRQPGSLVRRIPCQDDDDCTDGFARPTGGGRPPTSMPGNEGESRRSSGSRTSSPASLSSRATWNPGGGTSGTEIS
jgi:hypothetical protein